MCLSAGQRFLRKSPEDLDVRRATFQGNGRVLMEIVCFDILRLLAKYPHIPRRNMLDVWSVFVFVLVIPRFWVDPGLVRDGRETSFPAVGGGVVSGSGERDSEGVGGPPNRIQVYMFIAIQTSATKSTCVPFSIF